MSDICCTCYDGSCRACRLAEDRRQRELVDEARLEGAAVAFGLMAMAEAIAAWPCVNGEHWWQGDVCAECGLEWRESASPIRSTERKDGT